MRQKSEENTIKAENTKPYHTSLRLASRILCHLLCALLFIFCFLAQKARLKRRSETGSKTNMERGGARVCQLKSGSSNVHSHAASAAHPRGMSVEEIARRVKWAHACSPQASTHILSGLGRGFKCNSLCTCTVSARRGGLYVMYWRLLALWLCAGFCVSPKRRDSRTEKSDNASYWYWLCREFITMKKMRSVRSKLQETQYAFRSGSPDKRGATLLSRGIGRCAHTIELGSAWC